MVTGSFGQSLAMVNSIESMSIDVSLGLSQRVKIEYTLQRRATCQWPSTQQRAFLKCQPRSRVPSQ